MNVSRDRLPSPLEILSTVCLTESKTAQKNVCRRKRVMIAAKQKHEICIYAVQNPKMSCSQIAADMSLKYNINLKRRTIQDIVAERDYWLNPELAVSKRTRRTRGRFEQLENQLFLWYSQQLRRAERVKPAAIRHQAQAIAEELGETEFSATQKWLTKFKARFKITAKTEKEPELTQVRDMQSNACLSLISF